MNRHSTSSPDKSLAFQIRRAHLAFDRLLTARLSKQGVKSGYYNYLRALWVRDGVTQRQLSDITSVAETTSVALLKGMAAEGFITRARDEADKRKSYVFLTETGRSLEPALLPHALELNQIALDGISSQDILTCFSVIRRVAANLEGVFEAEGQSGAEARDRSVGPEPGRLMAR